MKKILLAFGLFWTVLWLGFGSFMAVEHEGHMASIAAAVEGGDLAEFWSAWRVWKVDAVNHAHGLLFAFIAIAVALTMDETKFSESTKNVLGWTLIVGIVVYTAASPLQLAGLMGLGGILTAAMVLMAFVDVVLGMRKA